MATINKELESIYDKYLATISKTGSVVCEKSICFLEAFVQHEGNLCEKIIRTRQPSSYHILPWGQNYSDILTIIGAYYLDQEKYMTGLFWSQKAIDMLNYFAPKLDEAKKKIIINNMAATSFVNEYANHFNEIAYADFLLDWER